MKSCKRCQKGKRREQKYGKVPPKTPDQVPWRNICVDLIFPYTLEGQDGKIMDIMSLPIIDLDTGWFKIVELPVISQLIEKDGKKSIKWTIDKLSTEVARLFNQQWLSRYPRAE